MTKQVLLAVGLLAGGAAAAVGAMPRGEQGIGAGRMSRMKQELGLSDEQAAKLRDIAESHRREAIRHRADEQIARLDLRRLLEAQTVDRKAVDAKVKELSDLQSAGMRSRVDMMLAMRDVLTPEQRQKFQDLRKSWRPERRWNRDGGRGRRGFGGPGPMGPVGPGAGADER